jgi:RND family efflux transporter MFP subunit
MLCAAFSLPGCTNAPAQAPVEDKRLKVDVSHPIIAEVTDYEDFTGRVEAANKVAIQAMVTGYLTKQNFVDGEEVEKDQVLFEIDDKLFQSKYDLAKATLVQSEARFERLTGDFERGQSLVPKALSREEFEKIKGDRLEAQAAVGMAKAQVKQAKDNLDYTKVLAPFKGKASRRMIDVGNMVKANETLLTYIYAIDPMYGYFDVDERTVIHIRKLINAGLMASYHEGKLMVQVGLADEDEFSLRGTVDWVDQVLDAGTGTQKMRCVIPQPRKTFIVRETTPSLSFALFGDAPGTTVERKVEKAQILVSPGMFVRVRLPVGTAQTAILIAERAVGTEQGKKFINLVDDKGKVERRYVELGQMHYGLRVVNPSAGQKRIEKTDRIVVNNMQRVGPGKEVIAAPVPMPQYAPAPVAATAGAGSTKPG